MAGALPVQSGERQLGYSVRDGYFAQYRVETLNPEHTVLEEARQFARRVGQATQRPDRADSVTVRIQRLCEFSPLA